MNDLINMSFIYYNNALDCIDKNNISGAKENLEKAVKIYLKDIDILNLLGICEYYLCDFNKANYYWNKSIRISKKENIATAYLDKLKTDEFNSFMNIYNKGLDYFNEKKYKEVIEVFNRLLSYQNKFIEIYKILIEVYLESGDTINAYKYIELLNKVDTGNKSIKIYKEKLLEIENKIIEKKAEIKKNSEKKYKVIFFLTVVLSLVFNTIMYVNLQKERNEKIAIRQKLERNKIAYEVLEKENDRLKKENYNDKYNNVTIEEQVKAEKYYFNKEYKNSIREFKRILYKTSDNAIKADAIYFIAASQIKLKKISDAKKYYEIYINNYENNASYDEVLYNYMIILNNKNEIKKSKQMATKLKNEYPNSEYNNSKVDFILKK